ncbi:MAG: hypothetical protein J0H94_05140 [Rhizobiales bacterium]|jgi:hypothetical protein|nr:hypothetical protein [Hyphomicrobiales bacterium]
MDELLAISFIAIGAGLACGFALNIWAMMVLMLLVTVELMDFWLEGIASAGVFVAAWLCFTFFVQVGFTVALASWAAFPREYRS